MSIKNIRNLLFNFFIVIKGWKLKLIVETQKNQSQGKVIFCYFYHFSVTKKLQ